MKDISQKRLSLLLTFVLTLIVGFLTPVAGVLAQSEVAATSRSVAPVKAAGTLADLRSRIDEIVRQPALAPGFFAVKIVSLDNGQIVYEQDANKFVRPASNMKLYTVAAAFDR